MIDDSIFYLHNFAVYPSKFALLLNLKKKKIEDIQRTVYTHRLNIDE